MKSGSSCSGGTGENMSDQKHLTLEGRIAIEKGLDNRLSFKAIALSVDKCVL
jgi:IS30 family transposase